MERQDINSNSLEDQMKKFLDAAEAEPPVHLWDAIQNELDREDAVVYKRKAVIYRNLAAAAVLLFIASVTMYSLFGNRNPVPSLVVIERSDPGAVVYPPHPGSSGDWSVPSALNSSSVTEEGNALASVGLSSGNGIQDRNIKSLSQLAYAEKNLQTGSNTGQNNDVFPNGNNSGANSPSDNGETTTSGIAPVRIAGAQEVANSASFFANLQMVAPEEQKVGSYNRVLVNTMDFRRKPELLHDRDFSAEVVIAPVMRYDLLPVSKSKALAANYNEWADLSLSSGVYQPNYQMQQRGPLQFSDPVQPARREIIRGENVADPGLNNVSNQAEDQTTNYSYNVTANYGKEITDKIFLRAGISYGQFSTISSTNLVLDINNSESRVAVTEQIIADGDLDLPNGNFRIEPENAELENTFVFASVPVQAGYLVVDKRFSIAVNGGLITSFYLGNTITDPDNVLEDVTITRQNNSTYRDVNFSLTTGLTFGYRFTDRYLLSIEPQYQRAINSVIRDRSLFESRPENLGISAGIRMFFK